jgi:hypothetical protein
MYNIAFWKNWPKAEQFFLAALGLFFLSSILLFWNAYFQYPAPAINWEHYEEIQNEEVTLRTIPVGLFDLPVKADNFFVFETQLGSPLIVSTAYHYIYLTLFAISICVLLTIITTLKRFWFLAGMTLFSVFAVSLNLESVAIMGLTNKYPTFVFLFTCIALCYYLHAIGTHVTFFVRLVLIAVVFILTGLVILFYSETATPFLHLSANSYLFSVGLTVIFLLMIGHEIPAAFINVITSGVRQTKSLRHFVIISGFYILNLILAYIKESGYLGWDIWLINTYILLTLSAVLSVWGFLQRSHQYENILASESLASFLILAFGIIAFSTFGLLFISANENAIEVLHDIILYSHTGYGIIFLFYVFANFGSMLTQNLQVSKVLYKPTVMFYLTFRIMGFITCVAFLIYDTSYRTLTDQLYASYYNGMGDVYYQQGADQLAEGYYNKSILYRNQNHHAHYALAYIQENRLELLKKKDELADISFSNPSVEAFINLSETFHETGESREALVILKEAKKKFPESGRIHNALGVAFSRLNMADSALLSFQEARKDKAIRTAAETNLLAASAKFKVSYPADSLLELVGASKEGAVANALALANMQNIEIQNEFITSTDTIWTPTRVTYLCNYLINKPTGLDTTRIKEIIEVARKPSNEYYAEAVVVAAAQALYAHGKIKQAFDLTREMAFRSGRGRYYALLGYWALEQNNPTIAANYFQIAKDKKIPHAILYEALALTEADSIQLAKPLWDSLAVTSEKTDSILARTMQKLFTTNEINEFTDVEKYWYSRYRIPLSDSSAFFGVLSSVQNPEIQTRAILDAAKKWYQQDELEIAATYLNRIEAVVSEKLNNELLICQLLLLAQLDSETFQKQPIEFSANIRASFPNEVLLIQTWQAELAGKSEFVKDNYTHLSSASIHFEDGLVASAHYFESDTTDRLKPYSILVSGLIARPNSIKLLKAHTKYAAQIGFDDEATESLEKLRQLLSVREFNRFVTENPEIFTVQDELL